MNIIYMNSIGSSVSDGYDTHSGGRDETPPPRDHSLTRQDMTRLREGESGGKKPAPSRYMSKKDSTGRGGRTAMVLYGYRIMRVLLPLINNTQTNTSQILCTNDSQWILVLESN